MTSPAGTDPASLDDLRRLELRVATVVAARANPAAHGPAVALELDLGPELGRRTSSARLAGDYDPAALVGRQVVVAAGLPPRRVAGVRSEALVLAAVTAAGETRLLAPDRAVPDGSPVA